jgi:hypothetical protein
MKSAGPFIMALGVMIVLLGALAWAGWLSWFGRLPGDIRVEREHTRFYMPITSMIIVSVVLSVLLAVLRRLVR